MRILWNRLTLCRARCTNGTQYSLKKHASQRNIFIYTKKYIEIWNILTQIVMFGNIIISSVANHSFFNTQSISPADHLTMWFFLFCFKYVFTTCACQTGVYCLKYRSLDRSFAETAHQSSSHTLLQSDSAFCIVVAKKIQKMRQFLPKID